MMITLTGCPKSIKSKSNVCLSSPQAISKPCIDYSAHSSLLGARRKKLLEKLRDDNAITGQEAFLDRAVMLEEKRKSNVRGKHINYHNLSECSGV